MGLDNGIIARSKEPIKALKDFEDKTGWDDYDGHEYDICYWRKCWNIRYTILRGIINYNCREEKYEHPLTIDHIDAIIYMLGHFNEDNWQEAGGSIWSFDDMRPCLKRDIKVLKKLRKVMKKHEIEVWFYDSY